MATDPSQLMQLAQSLARSAPAQSAPPPDYTGDINGINRDYALADALAQQQYIPNSGWLGALAQAVSGGLSYYKGKKADKAASEVSSKLRAEEQAQKQAEAQRKAQERASNIERLAASYGITPEQASVVADGLGKAADFKPPEPEKPKYFRLGNQLVSVGPDGKPSVVITAPKEEAANAGSQSDFDAYMKYTPEQRALYDQFKGRGGNGTTVYDPSTGQPLVQIGGAGKLSTQNTNAVQGDVLAAMDSLAKLEGMGKKFADEYLTYGGRAKAAVGSVLDKAGTNVGQDLQQFNADRSKLVQDAEAFFQQYRKQITGAAAAAKELEDLKKASINMDMGPEEFKARYDNLIATIKGDLARKQGQLGQIIPNSSASQQAQSGWGIVEE